MRTELLFEEQSSKSSKTDIIVHNVHIIDSSGSMRGARWTAALEGANMDSDSCTNNKDVNFSFTTCIFSKRSEIVFPAVCVPQPYVITINDFIGSYTALLDAIGNTIETLEAKRQKGEKVLIKVFTDGGENDSKKWSRGGVRALINHLEGDYTFTFTGPQPVVQFAKGIGFDASNCLVHDNTAEGIARAYSATMDSTTQYAKRVAKGEEATRDFYHKQTS